jgi:hypothetical protein
VGTVPGTTTGYGDLTLLSEQNATPTTVTNLRGPQYMNSNGPRIRFSNDQRDCFFSFFVYDTRTSSYILVRYNGPISDIFQPGFVPFTSDDPRLVYLTTMSINWGIWDWDPTGTMLTYSGTNAAWKRLIYFYDIINNASTMVNDPAVSGMNLTIPWCSSTEFRLFGPATNQNGTKGIVSFYPATGQFRWVIKEGGWGSKNISSFSSTVISPDGTTLAFGLVRIVNNQHVQSLVRVPANGGSYTPLVTYTDSSTNSIVAGGLGWMW